MVVTTKLLQTPDNEQYIKDKDNRGQAEVPSKPRFESKRSTPPTMSRTCCAS